MQIFNEAGKYSAMWTEWLKLLQIGFEGPVASGCGESSKMPADRLSAVGANIYDTTLFQDGDNEDPDSAVEDCILQMRRCVLILGYWERSLERELRKRETNLLGSEECEMKDASGETSCSTASARSRSPRKLFGLPKVDRSQVKPRSKLKQPILGRSHSLKSGLGQPPSTAISGKDVGGSGMPGGKEGKGGEVRGRVVLAERSFEG